MRGCEVWGIRENESGRKKDEDCMQKEEEMGEVGINRELGTF